MTRTAASPILHLIRRVAEDQRLKDLPDQELLRHFLTGHDKAAFDALLRRHGPMVLAVCGNVLGNEQDAEDAFQATFLVLAQKAGEIRKTSSVGSWLYGVAYRTAMRARTSSAKRRKHEARIPSRTVTPPGDDLTWREVQQLLYAELNRLPERHRAPLVHCYLEGKSQDETARLLGVSRPALKKRLEVGRALLRTRLVRQGLGPAAVLAVSAWPSAKAAALIPLALADSTVKGAGLIGAGEAVKGLISPNVLALAEGVLKAMFLTKLKLVSAVVLTALVGAGLVGWSYQATAQAPKSPGQTAGLFTKTETGQSSSQGPTQGGSAALAERPAADELDALRLEIDALRREVRADRERIKILEAEVRGRKKQRAGLNQSQETAPGKTYQIEQGIEYPRTGYRVDVAPGTKEYRVDEYRVDVAPGANQNRKKPPSDYLAEAEAALKRLRQDPGDKGAAELLETATRQLGARARGEGRRNRDTQPPRQ
jgi:RNA polymerase sigma factor (sigma-70 family)